MTTRHPGPSELAGHLLTRSELTAMLEHIFYRMRGDTRVELATRMPDAYQRLTGATDETIGMLSVDRLAALTKAALATVGGPSYDAPNEHIRKSVTDRLAAPFGGN